MEWIKQIVFSFQFSVFSNSKSLTQHSALSTLLLLMFLLSGCTGGAVVFEPTPLPPDTSPLMYTAPGGVFTLTLPQNWAVYEQILPAFIGVSFAPPNSPEPLVTIGVLNLGQAVEPALSEYVNQYQTQIRPDLERYNEQDRQLMNDNSWRITGVRTLPGGTTQQVNTFVQGEGTLLAVMEVIVPLDPLRLNETQLFINTLQLANETILPVGTLSTLASLSAVGLEVVNVSTWTTASGVFFITGEVANHSAIPLGNVPVRAVLSQSDGTAIAEAVDVVMGYAVPPGGFAPFGLRFGQGQPPETTSFEVTLGSADWQPEPLEIVSSGVLTWEAATQFGQDGSLFVTGTVMNTGNMPVKNLRAITTVFDADQRVIGAGFADIAEIVLAPQASTDFTILLSEIGGAPMNYLVNVQAFQCADEVC